MLKPRSCTRFPTPVGNDDRLVRRDPAQGAPIEMIEMRVGHEDEYRLKADDQCESRGASGV